MDTINHYLTLAPVQEAGTIAFLAALGLLAGSSLLAFFAEFKSDTGARADYSVLSAKICNAALVWTIILGFFGAATVFLPELSVPAGRPELKIVAAAGGLALLLFLVYAFTCGRLKIRFIHALLALAAAIAALTAAGWWYLPHTCSAWYETGGHLTGNQEIFNWWLGREEVARFIRFIFSALSLSAVIFLLANAREKENKRKQPREYYFKAAIFGEAWLICVVTLQLIPAAWLYYNHTLGAGFELWHRPEIYWLAASLLFFLLGWLLLLKIVIDGLVNRRATLIIAILFFFSLGLFYFGPLDRHLPKAGGTPATGAATSPAPARPRPKPAK